jgi:predicted thioesterase
MSSGAEGVLAVGLTTEASQIVTEERSASHLGSGALRVFATPSMVQFIEQNCHKLAARFLAPGKSTVGVSLQIRHLAPTPVGQQVTVRAEIIHLEGNLITFRAEVFDAVEVVGRAEHVRAIIDVERFLKRVEAKGRAAAGPA